MRATNGGANSQSLVTRRYAQDEMLCMSHWSHVFHWAPVYDMNDESYFYTFAFCLQLARNHSRLRQYLIASKLTVKNRPLVPLI